VTTSRHDKSDKPDEGAKAPGQPRARRRYEKPRLVDYGPVSKLTQTGGITTRDTGSMKQVCL
jgi:hypothetical protein